MYSQKSSPDPTIWDQRAHRSPHRRCTPPDHPTPPGTRPSQRQRPPKKLTATNNTHGPVPCTATFERRAAAGRLAGRTTSGGSLTFITARVLQPKHPLFHTHTHKHTKHQYAIRSLSLFYYITILFRTCSRRLLSVHNPPSDGYMPTVEWQPNCKHLKGGLSLSIPYIVLTAYIFK